MIIAVTAVVKLLLGAYYKFKDRRHPSPVLKGLFTDSVLDFFITLSTLISFTLTGLQEYRWTATSVLPSARCC